MTLNFSLNENDFLQHQLFGASKSATIKQRRTKAWISYSAATLLVGVLFLIYEEYIVSFTQLILAILIILFFPRFHKYRFKEQYRKHIIENYRNRFGQPIRISFKDTHIEKNDIFGEARLAHSDIENITETGEYYYIKMRSGGHLTIPKQGLDTQHNVKQELKDLSKRLSIEFIEELEWSWT